MLEEVSRSVASGVTQSSAHRFLYERADPCLFGGSQLLQRESGRPHGAFVEVRPAVGVTEGLPEASTEFSIGPYVRKLCPTGIALGTIQETCGRAGWLGQETGHNALPETADSGGGHSPPPVTPKLASEGTHWTRMFWHMTLRRLDLNPEPTGGKPNAACTRFRSCSRIEDGVHHPGRRACQWVAGTEPDSGPIPRRPTPSGRGFRTARSEGMRNSAEKPATNDAGDAPLIRKGLVCHWQALGPFDVPHPVQDFDLAQPAGDESTLEPALGNLHRRSRVE